MPIYDDDEVGPGDSIAAARAFSERFLAAVKKLDDEEKSEKESRKAQRVRSMAVELEAANEPRRTRSRTGKLPPPRPRGDVMPSSSSGSGSSVNRRQKNSTRKEEKMDVVGSNGSDLHEEDDTQMDFCLNPGAPSRSSTAAKKRGRPSKKMPKLPAETTAGPVDATASENVEASNNVGCSSDAFDSSNNKRRRSEDTEDSSSEAESNDGIPMSVGRISEGVYHLENLVSTRVAYKEDVPKMESMNSVEYKVKWKGWPEPYNNWEPTDSLNAEYFKRKFWRQRLAASKTNNKLKKSDPRCGGRGATPKETFGSCVYDFFGGE